MCDWPKSDCDVSVTDRQTDMTTLSDFGRSRLRAPPTRARAGFARARPGVRGIRKTLQSCKYLQYVGRTEL